jgi:hypothetical protein
MGRFVPFALCQAVVPAEVFPAGDHDRVLPRLHLRARRCYRGKATRHDRVLSLSLSTPRIYGSYNSTSLFRLQIDGSPAHCSLVANGKNATVLACPRDVLSQEMLHKAANGRESAIPRHSRVSSFRFDMIQERKHAFGLDICDSQVGYRLVLLISQKQIEQFQSVTVGSYRIS